LTTEIPAGIDSHRNAALANALYQAGAGGAENFLIFPSFAG